MTGAINNLAASHAGAPLTSHQAVKEKRREETRVAEKRRARDAYEPVVTEVEAGEAVRTAEDSTQEQTREDHQQHAVGYEPTGRAMTDRSPRVDLSA